MRRSLVLVCALSAVLLAVAVPAHGQQEPAPVDVELDAGFAGMFVPGRPVPVRVELSSSSLVSGRLHLSTQMGPVEVVDFEVAGGAQEEHWVLLDTAMQDVVQVGALAEVDGRRTNVASAPARWESGSLLVGVLAGSALAAQPPRDVRTVVLDQELTFATLSPSLLDLGPHALAALDAIAVEERDLAALPAEHRSTLVGWVATGGTLYVDAAGGPVEDLPVGLHPTAGVAQNGAGRVVASDGALAAGRWADVVVPAPNRSIHEDGEVRQNLPHPDLHSEIFAVDLGRDLPPLGRLLAVLGIYALLVGPGAYLVLRGRPMLRWAAIPALAVLATGVLYISGDGVGEGTTVDVVDVIETGPAALASTRLVMATDQGRRTVTAPAGWAAELDDMFGFGLDHQVHQQRTLDGVEITVPAPAGGVGVLRASGPVELDGALEVEAVATADGVVRGTVRNTTRASLEAVAVFVGRTASADLGSLGPGDAADFEVEEANQFRFGADPFREHGQRTATGGGPVGATTTVVEPAPPPPPEMGPIVMEECDQFGNCTQCDGSGNCFGFGGGMAPPMNCDQFGNCFPHGGCGERGFCGAPDRPASLTAALWDRGSNVMAGAMVTAVGWTTDLAPVLDLGPGVAISDRRTALVGRAVPTVGADHLVDTGSLRSLVRAGMKGNGMIELVNRYDLPSSVAGRPVDLTRLRIDIPAMFTEVAFLTPSGEEVVRSGDQPADGRVEAGIPPSAVVNGHVFIRTALHFAVPPPGRELVLYEVSP